MPPADLGPDTGRRTLRVLLVEDSETDAELIVHSLGRALAGVSAERVECEQTYREALARGGWDVVLADHSLPRFDSLRALRILRESGADVPFIIVSGTLDEESAVSSMKGGAADYVTKGNLKRLAPAIEREVRDSEARRARLHLREELRESEERFRAAFESSATGMGLVSPEGRWLRVNPALCGITGYSSDELLRLHLRELSHPDDLEVGLEPLRRIVRGDSAGAEWEQRCLRKDGSTVWIQLTAGGLRSPDGRVTQLVAQAHDVTARRRTECALRESLVEKEALLKEVHHRVKNNLQVISSLLNLQSRTLPDAAAEPLREARGRVLAIALLYERLYRSRTLGAVDAVEYARELVSAMVPVFAPEGRVRCDVAGDPVALGLDQAVPCGLVLNELVSNALKHAFPDRRRGRVAVHVGAAEGRVTVSVEDDGAGLPHDLEERRRGSLGLELVAALARQLGGTLEVRGGAPTRFSVAFAHAP